MKQNNQKSAEEIILKVMQHFGYRHQYQVAEYFEVTAQTLSGWIKANAIPPKHLVKYNQEIAGINKKSRQNEQNAIYVELPAKTDDNQQIGRRLISISSVISLFAKSKRLLILLPSLFGGIACIYVFIIASPVYTSITKVLPIAEDRNAFSGITGMAAQLGLNLPTGTGRSIPWDELYPEIVRSENLMRKLIDKKINSEEYGSNIELENVLATEGNYVNKKDNVKSKMAVEDLKEMITVQKDRLSPIVTLYVNAFEPKYAQDLASAVIEESGKILIKLKTKQIREKRLFIENRIVEVQTSLRNSENALEKFRHTNRNINQSAALSIEENRLIREVKLQNSLYVTLKSQYEQAKIKEVEEATMIQVIDGPLKPLKMTSPKPFISISLFFFFGLALAVFTIYSQEYIFTTEKSDYYNSNRSNSKGGKSKNILKTSQPIKQA